MSIFGSKKLTAEDILKAIDGLTDDEKAKVLEKMNELHKFEDETQPVSSEAASADTDEDGGDHETLEESSENHEAEEPNTEELVESELEADAEVNCEQADNEETEAHDQENIGDTVKLLTDRIASLEASVKELTDLKAKLDEYLEKRKNAFGFKGNVPDGHKSMLDMSASELKEAIVTGQV